MNSRLQGLLAQHCRKIISVYCFNAVPDWCRCSFIATPSETALGWKKRSAYTYKGQKNSTLFFSDSIVSTWTYLLDNRMMCSSHHKCQLMTFSGKKLLASGQFTTSTFIHHSPPGSPSKLEEILIVVIPNHSLFRQNQDTHWPRAHHKIQFHCKFILFSYLPNLLSFTAPIPLLSQFKTIPVW